MKIKTKVKSRASRRGKLNRELKRELGKKLLGYSATAGAVLTIGTGAAEAVAVKFTSGVPITLTAPENDTMTFDLDIDGHGVNDVRFNVQSAWTSSGNLGANTLSFFDAWASMLNNPDHVNARFEGVAGAGTTAYNFYSAIKLATSANIGAGLFSTINTATAGNAGGAAWGNLADSVWSYNNGSLTYNKISSYGDFNNARGFMGVEFEIAGSSHYGWVDVEASHSGEGGAFSNELTIYGWGYETVAGAGIQAGVGEESNPVPEPATLVTLAMGAAGIYAWRRNRKRKGVKEVAQKGPQNS